MLADLAQDLVDRIRTISEFNNRVGLALGGSKIDPQMTTIDMPASWAVYRGDEPLSENVQSRGPSPNVVTFIVRILVPYESETDLILNQMPLIESVITTVNGKTPTTVPGSSGWKYEGQTIDEINANRLAYDQLYSTTIVYPCS